MRFFHISLEIYKFCNKKTLHPFRQLNCINPFFSKKKKKTTISFRRTERKTVEFRERHPKKVQFALIFKSLIYKDVYHEGLPKK